MLRQRLTARKYFLDKFTCMPSEITDFSQHMWARIVAAAQDFFTERGLAPVGLAEVALALRLPIVEVERYFPAGKVALLTAFIDHFLFKLRQQLAQHGLQSSNAIEEMLRVRRLQEDELPSQLRSLFMQELEAAYPQQYQALQAGRWTAVREFMQQNMQRGIAEGLYQPHLEVAQETQHWFEQVDAALQSAPTAQVLSRLLATQVTQFLARVTTPAGAYVTRRLQESAPYY